MSPSQPGASLVTAVHLGHVRLPPQHPRAAAGVCPIQAFVVRHPDGLILIDSGVGSGHELIDELYRPAVIPIIDALNGIGVDERDVVAIVNSHLHFDHCGQNHALGPVPVHVQAAELEAARAPRYTVDEWARIEPARQRVLDGDGAIADGVTILATPGHTPGHQSVLVESTGGGRELVVGQCTYSCDEFERGVVSLSDMHDESYRETGAASVERLLRLEPTVAHFSHDPTTYRPAGSHRP